MHKSFQPGECVQAYLVNMVNNTPTDATAVTITITSPDGASLVSEASMTRTDTGIYLYNYDLDTDATTGKYTVEAGVSMSGHVTKVYSTFRVR